MGKIALAAAACLFGGATAAQGALELVAGADRLAIESQSVAPAIASEHGPFLTVHGLGAGRWAWAQAHNGLEIAAFLCDRALGAPQEPATSSGESLTLVLQSIAATHRAAVTLNGDMTCGDYLKEGGE